MDKNEKEKLADMSHPKKHYISLICIFYRLLIFSSTNILADIKYPHSRFLSFLFQFCAVTTKLKEIIHLEISFCDVAKQTVHSKRFQTYFPNKTKNNRGCNGVLSCDIPKAIRKLWWPFLCKFGFLSTALHKTSRF